MENPKISIITTVYNDEDYVEKCISSILRQTFRNFEYILIDDGSTDNSLKIMEKYLKKDKRIKLITQGNQGIPSASNVGLGIAKGEFIARQDADDYSSVLRLETQLDFLKKYNYDLVGSWAFHKKGILFTDLNIGEKIKENNQFVHGTILFKKNILEKTGFYNEYFKLSCDYELLLRIYLAGYKMGNVQEPLYFLREVPSRVSNEKLYKQALYRTMAKMINLPNESGKKLFIDLLKYYLFRRKEKIFK